MNRSYTKKRRIFEANEKLEKKDLIKIFLKILQMIIYK